MTSSRPLGLGKSSAFGGRSITKCLGTLQPATPLTGERLLDIGCGDGTHTQILAGRLTQVDAVDVQADRLALVREQLAGTPLTGRAKVADRSAEDLRYQDATSDCVTAIEVPEHVTGLDHALTEVARVLRPGGVFAVTTTPSRWFPLETQWRPLIRGQRYRPAQVPSMPYLPPLHHGWADARSFMRRSLTSQLAAAGLAVRSVSCLFPPFDRSRIGPRIASVTDWLESTPLRVFGMALVVVTTKPTG